MERMPKVGVQLFHGSLFVVVGPWQCRVCWPDGGRFMSGSRWFSGWHRWEDDHG